MVTHLITLIIGMMAGASIGYLTAALMFAAAERRLREPDPVAEAELWTALAAELEDCDCGCLDDDDEEAWS